VWGRALAEVQRSTRRGAARIASPRLRYSIVRGLLSLAMLVANLIGVTVVFVVVRFVLPLPDVDDTAQATLIALGALLAYLALAVPIGAYWGLRQSRPVRDWWLSGEPATPEMQEKILALPRRMVLIYVWMWLVGAVLFSLLTLTFSRELALDVGLAVLLSAMGTWAFAYLLAERILRPVAAASLEAGLPDRTQTPGVTLRLMSTWGLTTGVPVVGLVLVGGGQIVGVYDATGDRIAVTALFLGGVTIVVGSLATLLVSRSIADPVVALRRAIARVRTGDLDARSQVYDGSEIGLLQAGFNEMVDGLRERERLHDLFGRQVGHEVARLAIERGVTLGGEVRDIAVLFIDIVGSTTMAAERPATEVVALLNRFFEVVVEITDQHGGFVNKFEGDAALCVFGAPLPRGDAAGDALRAARDLHRTLVRVVPELDAAIGVSAGPAVAGNIGSAARFEYTVIGDPVNEASRLTELAKGRPSRVLASATVVDRAAAATERNRWSADGEVVLRGRTAPTALRVPAGDA
jgi:adenylate cyclase